jgi:ABC-type dipeptide/oligopeptide/nickel transport system permease subunit
MPTVEKVAGLDAKSRRVYEGQLKARIGHFWHAYRESKRGLTGLIMVGGLVLIAIFAPIIAPYDPNKMVVAPHFTPPNRDNLFGTNDVGQDIFSQIVYSARISLSIAILIALTTITIATAVGIIAGFYGGRVDQIIMSFTDIFLVLPGIPLIIIVGAYLGPGFWNIVFVISILSWPGAARIIRAQTLSIKERTFVEATHALGGSNTFVMINCILPNVLPLIFANAVLRVVDAILLEAMVSFLGLGDPTRQSWGTMLYYAQQGMAFGIGAWWWIITPGICISIAAFGCSLIGTTLDDIFNPRLTTRTWG